MGSRLSLFIPTKTQTTPLSPKMLRPSLRRLSKFNSKHCPGTFAHNPQQLFTKEDVLKIQASPSYLKNNKLDREYHDWLVLTCAPFISPFGSFFWFFCGFCLIQTFIGEDSANAEIERTLALCR